MKLPRELGPIHFVGIGGIGMSGIAEVLLNQGYAVETAKKISPLKCPPAVPVLANPRGTRLASARH